MGATAYYHTGQEAFYCPQCAVPYFGASLEPLSAEQVQDVANLGSVVEPDHVYRLRCDGCSLLLASADGSIIVDY